MDMSYHTPARNSGHPTLRLTGLVLVAPCDGSRHPALGGLCQLANRPNSPVETSRTGAPVVGLTSRRGKPPDRT